MQFLSDDNGETYNRCHCRFRCRPATAYLNSDASFDLQSGRTSRSVTSTSGGPRNTGSSSTISTRLVASTTSAGEMLRCTLSVRLCSRLRTSCTSSTISDTATSHSSTARYPTRISAVNAGALARITSVRFTVVLPVLQLMHLIQITTGIRACLSMTRCSHSWKTRSGMYGTQECADPLVEVMRRMYTDRLICDNNCWHETGMDRRLRTNRSSA